MLEKVVFLDRDGVINKDSPAYIKNWAEFEYIPGSIDAIQRLTSSGFDTIIITNQSAINRKIMPLSELEYIFSMLKSSVQSKGGRIKDIFYCPHTPDDNCDCRKPKPGLIYQAQKRYNIDLSASCMVGDSARDIECAKNAGCGHAILVKTGNGIEAEKILAGKKLFPDHTAENLYEAVNWIMKLGK